MKRPILSALIAATLALGATAPTPAAANNDDLKRLLGGIATVVILGATIDHMRDKRKRDTYVAPTTRHKPTPHYNPVHRYKPKPQYNSVNRHKPVAPVIKRHHKIVPATCFRRIQTRQGPYPVFGNRCLRRNMHSLHALPQACSVQLRTHSGLRQGYSASCLRSYGWRRG